MLNHHLFTLSIEQTEDQNRSDPLPDRSPRLTPTPIRVSLSVVPNGKVAPATGSISRRT
jgi:hypothetical protein